MTDILDLEGWNVIAKHVDGDDYLIEAEYTVQPKACTKCGNIGNLYKYGPKPLHIRDSPIRGRPVRILANAQRYKCRECGATEEAKHASRAYRQVWEYMPLLWRNL